MALKFAFVMDPLENVLVDKDTTFAFMLEALARGHEVYFVGLKRSCTPAVIRRMRSRADAKLRARRRITASSTTVREYPLEHFDAIFMRKDPPADAALPLRHDDAQPRRHAPHLRHQRPDGPARGERKALRTEFSRRDSSHHRHL